MQQVNNNSSNNINSRYQQLQTKNIEMKNQQNPFSSPLLSKNTIGGQTSQNNQNSSFLAGQQQLPQPQPSSQVPSNQQYNIYSKNSYLFSSGQKNQQSSVPPNNNHNQSQDVPHKKSQSNDQAYQVQYKVGQIKTSNEKRPSQQPPTVLQQEVNHRNSRALEETYQSQTFNLRQKQQNIMSPTTQHHENSLLFHSPMQRQNGQGQRVTYIQSPSVQQPLQVVNGSSGSGLGLQVNYTTTAAISSEMQQVKESNLKLLAKIQQIESDVQRGMSQEFLKELEQKIFMLNQLNQKLESDNEKIQVQLNAPKLKDELVKCQNERNQLQNKLKLIQNEIPIWRNRFEELELREQENDNEQIRELVNELEGKVQGLINENERLNQLVKEKEEINKFQDQLANLKKQESNLKQKCRDVEKKNNQNRKENQEKVNQQNEWQARINDLEEKVQMLIEENQKLNSALQDSNDTELTDLEDRITVIVNDNKKMEEQIQSLKQKCSKSRH